MSYKVAFAEIMGEYHKSEGALCQDKTAYSIGERYACIALADGAGSRVYSEIGAKIATTAVCEYFNAFSDIEAFKEDDFLDFITEKMKASDCLYYDLACTLLFVFVKGNTALMGHIGDGYIFYTKDEYTEVISYPENGEEKNITYFVTDEDAAVHFRVQKMTINSNSTFLLTSDGGGDCLYSVIGNEPANAIRVFSDWLKSYDSQKVSRAIYNNLSEIGPTITLDDLSVIELFVE